MEDAPYGGYIRDAVTDSEVQRVEIEDYASLWVRLPLLTRTDTQKVFGMVDLIVLR